MKFWYNPNFLAIFFLVIFSIPALKSLTIPGFYTSHDGETHTARIAQYYQALIDGQIPPRFAGSFYNGLGSPIFVYIYPLPYFLGSLIHFLGFSFTTSFEVLAAAGFIFSAIFAYFWLKLIFKSEKAAFLGALFYGWVPYRLSTIYVRASISEILAYAFLPLVLYSLTKLAKSKNLFWIALSSISLSLLLLSQNLVAGITLPVIAGYVLIISFYRRSLKFFLQSLVVGIWGLAIAAVTYLPTFFERGFVKLDQIIRDTYPNHFATLKQLIYSPWGYGFDLPGTVNDAMSLQIGLAHLLIFLIAIFLVGYYFLKRITIVGRIGEYFIDEISKLTLVLSLFFLLIFILSVFLMIEIKPTVFVWQNFKPLQTIDIPWRFLGVSVIALSFLAAFVAKVVRSGLFFILLVIAVVIANRNHLRINQTVFREDSFFLNYLTTATQYGEFTPKWRQTARVPIDIVPDVKLETINGEVEFFNVAVKSNKITFRVKVISANAKVRINKFYFPGTAVGVDGQKLTAFKDLIITDPQNLFLEKEQDSSGLMMINLGEGDYQIEAKFGETPLRQLANFLTLGSTILALGIVIKNAKK